MGLYSSHLAAWRRDRDAGAMAGLGKRRGTSPRQSADKKRILELEREKPGTGLGLHIVHTLVRRLHGRIRVHDPTEGTGTVFEVRLPGRPINKPQSESSLLRSAPGAEVT